MSHDEELAPRNHRAMTVPQQYSRRIFAGLVVAGGIAVASPSVDAWAAAPPAGSGPYGSGTLGAWANMSQSVSSPQTISRVVAQDGLLGFGDSIGVSTFRDLATRLGAYGTGLAVNAKSGRPTAPTVDILNQWAITYRLPRRILMAVGSNDIFDPSRFSAQVDRVMAITGTNVTVYWPEIHVSRWSKPVGIQVADQRNSGWLNVQLYAAAAKHKNLRIISWASLLASQPASRIGAYLSDGVHTTAAGMAARNSMITSVVQPAESKPTS
jgi:lysophospholipase L1-like esterase